MNILRKLEENGIKYYLLRDYEKVLKKEELKDIDLVIPKKQIKKIKRFLHSEGYRISQDLGKNFFGDRVIDGNLFRINFKTDLLFGKKVKVSLFKKITKEEIHTSRIKEKEIFILPPTEELFLLVCHCCFDKKKFALKHKKRIEELLPKINTQQLQHLFKSLNQKYAKLILNKKYTSMLRLSKRTHLQKILKNPLRILNYLKFWFIHRFIRKSILVAITGCDGSGKTTLSNKIIKESNLNANYVYMGAKKEFDILPTKKIGKILNKKKIKQNKLRYNLGITAYVFEYFLRYLTRIYPPKIRNKNIIIVDRSMYDIFVEKPELKKGLFLKTLKNKFFNPDLLIYLTGDAKTLHKRKKEEPYEKLKIKIEKYNQAYQGVGIAIDATKTLKEIHKLITTKIWEVYSKKNKKIIS